ncbi:MAG: EamA family transporter [Candidatus Acidiferrales bacterium]
MTRVAVLLLVVVCASTAGELCITRAMKFVGEVKIFHPLELMRVFGRALRVGWMWIGLMLMMVAFLAMLIVLASENVSFVVPVTALSYAAGAYGSRVFLGERITSLRWLGVALVCIGVALVWRGQG